MLQWRINHSATWVRPPLLMVYPTPQCYWQLLSEIDDTNNEMVRRVSHGYYSDMYERMESLVLLLDRNNLKDIPDIFNDICNKIDSYRFVLNELLRQAQADKRRSESADKTDE
jgi:hypothetical protein